METSEIGEYPPLGLFTYETKTALNGMRMAKAERIENLPKIFALRNKNIMKVSKHWIITLLALVVLQSCGEKKKGQRTLPSSQGKEFSITVVVEDALTTDDHYVALQNALMKQYPMSGGDEDPYFTLRTIEIANFGNMTERDRYIVFLANTYENGEVTKAASGIFSHSAIQAIKTDPNKFMVVGQNVWADGQSVMYLAAKGKTELSKKIEANADAILKVFYEKEAARIKNNLYYWAEQLVENDRLFNEHKIKIRIPEAYNKAVMAASKDSILKTIGMDGFEWYNFDAKKSLSNIVITYAPYTDTVQLSTDSIIAVRNAIGKFIPCGVEGSYLGTELEEPMVKPTRKILEINGNYVVETLGWWDCQNATLAGPFVNYTVVDKKGGRIIYLDGFIAAKGQPKMKYLVRLKSVLQTIDF